VAMGGGHIFIIDRARGGWANPSQREGSLPKWLWGKVGFCDKGALQKGSPGRKTSCSQGEGGCGKGTVGGCYGHIEPRILYMDSGRGNSVLWKRGGKSYLFVSHGESWRDTEGVRGASKGWLTEQNGGREWGSYGGKGKSFSLALYFLTVIARKRIQGKEGRIHEL